MKCENCGKELKESERFCSYCGQNNDYFIEKEPVVYESAKSNGSGNYNENSSVQSPVGDIHIHYDGDGKVYSDKLSIGLGIMCFLIPLIGIIVYFSDRRTEPKKANASILISVISIVISLILSIIWG